MKKNNRILIIGQTPPPYGGQALMIQTLLDANFENASLYHIRLDFSKDFFDMGKFKLYKIYGLIKTILLAYIFRFRYNINTVYYGPSGPNKFAMYRDIILLCPIRLIFRRLILHTHAGGTANLYSSINPLLRYFFRMAYFKPDFLIKMTDFNQGDETILKPLNVVIIPNGIKDNYSKYHNSQNENKSNIVNLLYVGALYRERGIKDLIEAVRFLKEQKIYCHLRMVGIFINNDFKIEIMDYIEQNRLKDTVSFLGTKIGSEKWGIYNESDIFCFPTYVQSESFGLVLLEAMQFKIPIVATRWNGIPYIVDDNKNGLLINIKDPIDMSNAIKKLTLDKELRNSFGQHGREKFLQEYSLDKFIKNMDNIFRENFKY